MPHHGFLSIAVSLVHSHVLNSTMVGYFLGFFFNAHHSSVKSVQLYFTVCSVLFSLFVAITLNFILY